MNRYSFSVDTETIKEAIDWKYGSSGLKGSLDALEELEATDSKIEYNSTRPEDPADLKPWFRAINAGKKDGGFDIGLQNGVLHNPDYLTSEEGYRNAETRISNLEVMDNGQRLFEPDLLIFRAPEVDEYEDLNVVQNIRRAHKAIEEREDLVGTPSLENMPEQGTRTLLETSSDIDRVERLSSKKDYAMNYVLDVSYPKDLRRFAERLPADRVGEVQLSNRKTKPDGVETHLPLYIEDGDYNMTEVMSMIEDFFPEADLSVEIDPDHLNRRSIENTAEFLDNHL